jgi:peptide/nickel transport system substrate-binding protein
MRRFIDIAARLLLAVWIILTALTVAPVMAAEKLLRMGLDFVSPVADPHVIVSRSSHTLAFHIFEPLVMWDGDDKLRPLLAREWRQESPTRWLFTLRDKVRFHDGHTLRPEDVTFTFCRLDEINRQQSGLLYNIRSITPTGDGQLYIETRTPTPNLPRQLSRLAIVGAPNEWKGSYQAGNCPDTKKYQEADFVGGRVAGSGPYRLVAFQAATWTKLKRFDDYWGERPIWETVEMLAIEDGAERARAVVSGKVDIINFPPLESTGFFQQHPNTRIATGGINRTLFLIPNIRKRPGPSNLGNVAVRQAVSAAIDRRGLANRLMGGLAVPAFHPLPPDHPAYPGLQETLQTPPAGTKLPTRLELTTPPTYRRVADGVARYLRLAGMEVDIREVESSELPGIRKAGDFDLMIIGRILFDGDLAQQVRDTLLTPDRTQSVGIGNVQDYSNPALDKLVQQTLATADPVEHAALTREISRTLMRELPDIPLLHLARSWAMRSNLGYLDQADGLTLAANVLHLDLPNADVR